MLSRPPLGQGARGGMVDEGKSDAAAVLHLRATHQRLAPRNTCRSMRASIKFLLFSPDLNILRLFDRATQPAVYEKGACSRLALLLNDVFYQFLSTLSEWVSPCLTHTFSSDLQSCLICIAHANSFPQESTYILSLEIGEETKTGSFIP